MKGKNLRITVRLEKKQRKQIDDALFEDKAGSISELVRLSLREYLNEGELHATE